MNVPREEAAIKQAVERLVEIFEFFEWGGSAKLQLELGGDGNWDAVLAAMDQRFALLWKRSGSLAHISTAINEMQARQQGHSHDVIPLLAVPFMGEAGQELCAKGGLSWLDLSGNGKIVAPGIFYQNLGNPNRFRRPGRVESAFAPKGSRVSRQLLMEPDRAILQQNLAATTGLTEGHVSRIVKKLLDTGLVVRQEDGIRVTDAGKLLEAWREDYKFSRHEVIRGHIGAGAGDSLMRWLADSLSGIGEQYAATALPAAWMWTHHTGFRLSTIYMSRHPSEGLKNELGFREESRGANTWLVVPNDEGVFDGAQVVEGIN